MPAAAERALAVHADDGAGLVGLFLPGRSGNLPGRMRGEGGCVWIDASTAAADGLRQRAARGGGGGGRTPPAPLVHWTLLQGEGRSADDGYNSIYRLGTARQRRARSTNFDHPPVNTLPPRRSAPCAAPLPLSGSIARTNDCKSTWPKRARLHTRPPPATISGGPWTPHALLSSLHGISSLRVGQQPGSHGDHVALWRPGAVRIVRVAMRSMKSQPRGAHLHGPVWPARPGRQSRDRPSPRCACGTPSHRLAMMPRQALVSSPEVHLGAGAGRACVRRLWLRRPQPNRRTMLTWSMTTP